MKDRSPDRESDATLGSDGAAVLRIETRAPLRRAAEWVRERPVRVAVVLCAAYYVLGHLDRITLAVSRTLLRPLSADWAWRDLFTLQGSLEALGEALALGQSVLGNGTFTAALEVLACLLVVRWLHDTGWREAFRRLGLARPRVRELAVPALACAPFLVISMVRFRDEPQEGFLRTWFSAGAVSANVLFLGLLVRGLFRDARLGFLPVLAIVYGLTTLLPFVQVALTYEDEFVAHMAWSSAGALPVSAALLFTFRRWGLSVWPFVVLTILSTVGVALMPYAALEDPWVNVWRLWGPLLVLFLHALFFPAPGPEPRRA